MAKSADRQSLDELKHLIRTIPVIDNHAHNILRPNQLRTHNFLTITTEASDEALEDAPTSLPHLRAQRQLKQLYGLSASADWEDIKEKRLELLSHDADTLHKRCLEGVQTILVDDGLDSGEGVEPYSWLDKFTPSPCKRIVRIEAVAASILSRLHQQGKLPVGVAVADEEACSLAWVTFVTSFEQAVLAALVDDEVVGFKSVVCYRTGLDVSVGRDVEVTENGLRSFRRHYLPACTARSFRVETKGMNDALVISTCKLIAASYQQQGRSKPFQFHTGLGDNDISLEASNPALLQPLIKAFPKVPIVLLHSSYPYTQEAGYLATVYKNVYLDIGEVFPMVSREGQETLLRQALSLTPTSKILWSSDGHYFPETYWLANVQGREVMETVLCDFVEKEDLNVGQAMQATKEIFFDNSDSLYNLHCTPTRAVNLTERPKATEDRENRGHSSVMAMQSQPHEGANEGNISLTENQRMLQSFMTEHDDVRFIIVQWLDYLGTIRSRVLTIEGFNKLINAGSRIGISRGNLGTLQNDQMTPVCEPVGQVMVEPDVSSLRVLPHSSLKNTATVMARFTAEEGMPLGLCPRSELQRLLDTFALEHNVKFLVGFEIETTFCRRTHDEAGGGDEFKPLDTNHAWGTLTDEQSLEGFPLMFQITEQLQTMGIEVQQLHSEAGAGQYEFVLPPLPPVQAVDMLIQARQAIQQSAAQRGLRATYHPMPFPGIGTAAHANISFDSDKLADAEVEQLEMSFMASLLELMPALCAFTMPQDVSYGRVAEDSWTGGVWVAWGSQNREVPLRKIPGRKGSRRWETRFLDGCANIYLALASIFAAGLRGVKAGAEMKIKDCTRNPSKLSEAEKEHLGITQKLPMSITQAVRALESSEDMDRAMSAGIVRHFVAMKKAEQEMLNAMPEGDRRVWLMKTY